MNKSENSTKQTRAVFLADCSLVVSMIVYLIVISALCIYVIMQLQTGEMKTETENDRIGIQVIFGVLGFLNILAVMAGSNRWLATFIFTDDGISYRAGFRKATVQPYRAFRYIYAARYFHGSPIGIGNYRRFIVLSTRRLSTDEIENINQVAPSTVVVKIRFRKSTYEKICSILPAKQRVQLEACFRS